MQRTGKCLCGAVRFTAELHPKISACHCGMCRQWTGGVLLTASAKDIRFEGEDAITVYTSSDWAERGFCSRCGSSLFFRITAKGPYEGMTSVAFGALEDTSEMSLETEWFIDHKPQAYAFAGEHKLLTEAEAMAMLNS